MKEIEKRLGLDKPSADRLVSELDGQLPRSSSVARTVLVNVNGEGFTPNPAASTDTKIKLIGADSVLSIKRGSWHGDAEREEYDINFRREDLANVIGGVAALGSNNFILLSTLRTTWRIDGLMHTMDEYRNVSKALFEIEASGVYGENQVDQAFADLGIEPMDSTSTINFINAINQDPATQVDLSRTTPQEVAQRMLEVHPDVS